MHGKWPHLVVPIVVSLVTLCLFTGALCFSVTGDMGNAALLLLTVSVLFYLPMPHLQLSLHDERKKYRGKHGSPIGKGRWTAAYRADRKRVLKKIGHGEKVLDQGYLTLSTYCELKLWTVWDLLSAETLLKKKLKGTAKVYSVDWTNSEYVQEYVGTRTMIDEERWRQYIKRNVCKDAKKKGVVVLDDVNADNVGIRPDGSKVLVDVDIETGGFPQRTTNVPGLMQRLCP